MTVRLVKGWAKKASPCLHAMKLDARELMKPSKNNNEALRPEVDKPRQPLTI